MSLSGDLVVFIDAENAAAKWGVPLYVWLCQNFKVRECYCVGNRAKVAKEYLLLEGTKFHLVNSMLGKDSADTWLVMLGARELCLRSSVKKIAILSNDRDFAPLAYLAAERGKKLVIYAAKNNGTEGLKQAIQRTEAGEAAAVEVIELDKLVGRQLEKPKANLKSKILMGAKNLMKLPQKVMKKKSPALPGAEVMAAHELVPQEKKKKAKAAPKPAPQPQKKKPKAAPEAKRELALPFSQPGGESEKLFKQMPAGIHNYFARRRDQVKLILAVGLQGDFLEVPFVEGIHSVMFLRILMDYGVIKDTKVDAGFFKSLGLSCKDNIISFDRAGLAEADKA